MEAADEICRQLRLRDLGGLVINDLIDMGKISNRKKIEEKFENNLERDRARASILPISRFGLMEMTRQRIRPSVLDSDYGECRHCEGRGIIKTAEEVASDATRHAGWILNDKRVHRVELACSASVGTSLLSNKRNELNKYEQSSGKRIVIRISETISTDQVAYFPYDKRGADIDVTSLEAPIPPTIKELLIAEKKIVVDSEEKPAKRGRRRLKKNPLADATTITEDSDLDAEVAMLDKPQSTKKTKKEDSPAQSALRVYELARRIGKSSKEVIERCKEAEITVANHMSKLTTAIASNIESLFVIEGEEIKAPSQRRKRRGGRRRRRKPLHADQDQNTQSETSETNEQKDTSSKTSKSQTSRGTSKRNVAVKDSKEDTDESKKTKQKKTSRRRQKKKEETVVSQTSKKKNVIRKGTKKKTVRKTTEHKPVVKKVPKKPARRTLYGSSRRNVTSEETTTSRSDRE